MAWQDIFDTLNGNAWSNCSHTRNDPCSCKRASGDANDNTGVRCGSGGGGAKPTVPCTAGKCNILGLGLTGITGMEGRPLPTSVGDLKELVSIDIEGCKIAGPVPESFKSLTKLRGFQIAQNRFTSLPALNFNQFAHGADGGWCDVCDNPFVCPLPLGAKDCHDNDCPPSCVDGPTPSPQTPCSQKCMDMACSSGCLDSNNHCWSAADIPENTCKQHPDFCWCS